MSTKIKNGAKAPRMAKLKENPKQLLNEQAQDHDFMSDASNESVDLRPELKKNSTKKAQRAVRIYEAGNANNTFNFDLEIAAVIVFGIRYAPSNPLLQILQMQALLVEAQQALSNVNNEFNALKQALDIRHALYEGMLKLATRMMGELRSCGASKATIDKATSYNLKIQGRRAKKINPDSPDKVISASHTSFAQRALNFDGLIGVCEIETLYNPSELALQITTLKTYLADMQVANSAAALAQAKLTSARTERNKVLYMPVTGLVDIAIAVKEYVKAVFGFKSPEYNQVRHLQFKKRPIA